MGKRAKASRANDQDTLSSRPSGRRRRKRDIHIHIGTEGWKKERERGEGIESASHRRERESGGEERQGRKMREGVRPITQADGANQGAMRLP